MIDDKSEPTTDHCCDGVRNHHAKQRQPSITRARGEGSADEPRTLQRRLNVAGVNFSEIMERGGAALACKLLADSCEDIKTISERLGYRDPSSFSRAFRRWAGVSPRQYRRLNADTRH